MKGQKENIILSEYKSLLDELKEKIKYAQIKAVLSVNQELIKLYWDIGKAISEKQEQANWGNSVVEKIAKDIKKEFPLLKGLSRSNIFSMQQFFKAYRNEDEIVQQLVGQIPWGRNMLSILLEILKNRLVLVNTN